MDHRKLKKNPYFSFCLNWNQEFECWITLCWGVICMKIKSPNLG